MKWDHRIVKTAEGFTLAEVSYGEDGKPFAHNAPFLYGESVDEMKTLAARLLIATGEPVIDFTGAEPVENPALTPVYLF